jgi:hypothetical protein
MFLALSSTLTISAATQTKCEFEGLNLADFKDENARFKNNPKTDKIIDLPKIFSSYEGTLGTFSAEDCKKSIRKTQLQSLASQKTYTIFYTVEDNCDGGNSYGLIMTTKSSSPNKDGVVALITDSDITCL